MRFLKTWQHGLCVCVHREVDKANYNQAGNHLPHNLFEGESFVIDIVCAKSHMKDYWMTTPL